MVYCGHDVNLWAMLNNFGLASTECLKKKIDDKSSDLFDIKCQGNPEFSSNLVLVLRRPPVMDGHPKNEDNVYVGRENKFSNLKRCIKRTKTSLGISRIQIRIRLWPTILRNLKLLFSIHLLLLIVNIILFVIIMILQNP